MILNIDNVEKAIEVIGYIEKEILKGRPNDEFSILISPDAKLNAVVNVFAVLEQNERYNKSPEKIIAPSDAQINFLYGVLKESLDKGDNLYQRLGGYGLKELNGFVNLVKSCEKKYNEQNKLIPSSDVTNYIRANIDREIVSRILKDFTGR